MSTFDHMVDLTPEFKAAITRRTWDSRERPAVVTLWVGDLPVFKKPTGHLMAPGDTLTVHLDGYSWEAEDVNPRPPVRRKIPARRRFLRWLDR